MTAPTFTPGVRKGKARDRGRIPAALVPMLVDSLQVILEPEGTKVRVADEALDLLRHGRWAGLTYRHIWPEVLVTDLWPEHAIEDEALCELEDVVHREGLRITGTPVLTWSAPRRDGTRWLVATCTVAPR